MTLTVTSMPAGAIIRSDHGEGDAVMSTFVAEWEKSDLDRHMDNGCWRIKSFTATWPSGATASTERTVRLCGGQKQYGLVINRPRTAPGGQQDYEFSLKAAAEQRQVQQAEQAARQAQADARANAVIEGLAAGFAAGMDARAARQQQAQPVQIAPMRCISRRKISGAVETECN
ncbi:hypothetical protein [Acidovorax sp. LjRoot66]|uniref:hypothetical protein n=1 Tax=Acidovorax sp. LjRoot66 TaxID=3342334 RepID=UPI003F4FE2C4